MRESQYKTASSRHTTAATSRAQTNRASDELMKCSLEAEENIDLRTFVPPTPPLTPPHWFKVMHGCSFPELPGGMLCEGPLGSHRNT